jgi:hypothetical protein
MAEGRGRRVTRYFKGWAGGARSLRGCSQSVTQFAVYSDSSPCSSPA